MYTSWLARHYGEVNQTSMHVNIFIRPSFHRNVQRKNLCIPFVEYLALELESIPDRPGSVALRSGLSLLLQLFCPSPEPEV